MNREIEFRGKSINTGKWVFGSVHIGLGSWITLKSRDEAKGLQPFHPIQVIPETVGQYTGLKDASKNKVKIFEGNIIRSFDSQGNEIKHLVSYNKSNACFCAEFIPYNEINPSCGIKQKWIDEFEKEVIGDKFNNPELLKGGD